MRHYAVALQTTNSGPKRIMESRQTYSSELRILQKPKAKIDNASANKLKGFQLQLARHDMFYIQLVNPTAAVRMKLCEAYAVLRQRRKLLREYAAIKKEYSDENYQRLFLIMDKERLWVEKFVLSEELPKRCDSTIKEVLSGWFNAQSIPKIDGKGRLINISTAKRMRQSLLILQRKGFILSKNEELLTAAVDRLKEQQQVQ